MEKFDRKTPASAVGYFRDCLKNGDVNAAVKCFDAQGLYIDRTGKEMRTPADIRMAMESLCLLKPLIVGAVAHITLVDDLAFWLDKWVMSGKTRDGHLIEMNGHTSCILKRNEAGIWLWLIDNPFGSAILGN
ncbi:YybH family protein [Pedobacter caeni]|uniref:Ketosteroid isomerase homolog n=1 Tax=Pedobacter caeni TaxID=288992 RepID=A0A1M5EH97_9SPHI|nr:hypothetical protein [Pedobacter caeni]SHF78609.1 hypothetical protein SAMN04488522_103651 [Pedobacter caeni]